MAPPPISRFVLWFFRRIVRGYFRRHFAGVRLSQASNLEAFSAEKLIIYANHSSWWDPMVLVLLGQTEMPKRDHFAPMDASALERYGIFKRIGVFGVEMKTARGAAQFLRTGSAILQSGGVLWVTPQGRFADSRERPLAFKPGLAALAAKMEGGCTVLPLAIEYVFWDERLPETLLHFGDPVTIHGQSTDETQQLLEAALLKTMETLKAEAMSRNPAVFSLVHDGTVGTGGFYELGQRLLATLRRKPFQPNHTAIATPPPIPHEERG
jgi:1-acyl-sn-glycerol-3-phosphate acyltransferase